MHFAIFVVIFLCCTLCSCNSDDNPSIVIIGAGASGIAAATRLIKNGLTNIKILEAEDRIGGRINSVKFGDAFVDLGAEWCEGEGDDIIVYKLANQYNVLKPERLNGSFLSYSGGELDDDIYDDIENSVRDFFITDDCFNASFRNFSAKDYFVQMYTPILEKYKDDPKKSQQAKESIDYYAASNVESNEGVFDWSDISFFQNYGKPGQITTNFHWNGLGFHTILNILMEKYPDPEKGLPIDDKFVLSKEVKTIYWNNDNKKAKIECTDGSDFEADHVIFTPSIGVLKNHHETLFNPKLPEDKIEAFNKLGFGAVVKIALHFEDPWWHPEDDLMFIMWSDEDKEKFLSEFPNAPHKDNRSWLSSLSFLEHAENNPKVLMCWVTGPTVPEVETLNQEDMKNGVMHAIRKVFGRQYNVTDPDDIIHSKWWTNPHFHGTLTYETLETNNLDEHDYRAILAKPLENDGKMVLQFAGEATHSILYSTVHGAIESGFREANRLLKLYNKNIVQ